jgi:hypothetical protein
VRARFFGFSGEQEELSSAAKWRKNTAQGAKLWVYVGNEQAPKRRRKSSDGVSKDLTPAARYNRNLSDNKPRLGGVQFQVLHRQYAMIVTSDLAHAIEGVESFRT